MIQNYAQIVGINLTCAERHRFVKRFSEDCQAPSANLGSYINSSDEENDCQKGLVA